MSALALLPVAYLHTTHPVLRAVYYCLMSETPVVVQNVSKRFGSTTALDSVSWAPKRGEVTALVGLNGAGKSTLMRVMTGLIKASSGTVTVKPANGHRPLSAMI